MGKYKLKNGMEINTIQELCVVFDEELMLPEYFQKGGKYEDLVESFIAFSFKDKSDKPICFISEDRILGKRDLQDILPDSFETIEDLKLYVKKFDTGTLELFTKSLAGVDKVSKKYYYYAYYRSHLVSVLIRYYFPHKTRAKGANQRVSKYQQYTNVDLKRMCRKNNVEFKVVQHKGIQRMNMVMALEKAGVLTKDDRLVSLRKDIANYERTPDVIVSDREKRKVQEKNSILEAICHSLGTGEDLRKEEKFGKI